MKAENYYFYVTNLLYFYQRNKTSTIIENMNYWVILEIEEKNWRFVIKNLTKVYKLGVYLKGKLVVSYIKGC